MCVTLSKTELSRKSSSQCVCALVTLGLVTLMLLDVSIQGSLTLVFAFVVLLFFGNGLALRLVKKEPSSGVSLLLGSGVLVLFAQILLAIGIDHRFAHWISLGVIAVCATWLHFARFEGSAFNQVALAREMLFAVPLGLIAVGLSHNWLLPFGLSVVVAHRIFQQSPFRRFTRIAVLSGVGLGWLVSKSLRPERWWYYYQGHSSQYHEALSWSSAWFGIFEQPGYIGGTIENYHWFSFAFFGGLSSLASLGPYVALTKLSPLIVSIMFASLFVLRPDRLPKALSARWTVVLLAVVAMDTNRMESVTFAVLIALAFLTVVGDTLEVRPDRGLLAMFLLMSLVLFLSKVPVALVIGVIASFLVVIQVMRGERITWLPPVTLFVVSAAYSLVFMPNNDPEMWGRFQTSISSSLIELSDRLEPRSFLNLTLWSLVPMSLGRRWWRGWRTIDVVTVTVAVVSFCGHIVLSGQHTIYFGITGTALLTFVAVKKLDGALDTTDSVRLPIMQMLVASSVVLWSVVGYVSVKEFRKVVDDYFILGGSFGDFVSNVLKTSGSLVGLLIVGTILSVVKRGRVVPVLLLVASLGVFAGQTSEWYRQLRYWGPEIYESSEPMYGVFGGADLRALAQFVSTETDESAVLASNQFCCSGDAWVNPELPEFSALYLPSGALNQARYGGHDYLLPAHLRRRFLAQGVRLYLLLQDQSISKDEPFERLRLSVAFANQPSMDVVRELQARNVTGFVVNLSLTERDDWSEYGRELFRVGNFAYIDLT